jgi:two-component system chemotaxis response regulator CheB
MPRNALQYTTADHVVGESELASLIRRLVAEPLPAVEESPASRELELEVRIAMEEPALQQHVMTLGPVSPYTCPECHGVLVRVEEGGPPRFRCHTGHAFSLDSLLASLTETVEATLWSALRAVEESVLLLRETAARAAANAPGAASGRGADPRFEQKAREAEARAGLIRQAVLRHQALSLESIRAAAEDPAKPRAATHPNGEGSWHAPDGRA